MSREKTQLWMSLPLAIAVLTGMAAVCSLAVGFFVLPFIVGVAAWALFYWALRHQGRRNPLSPPDVGPSGIWDDGQPLDRALENLTQARAAKDALRLDDEANERHRVIVEAEREEEVRRTDPRDFQGPPPFVPFP
jgi:hypothetical protein